MILVGFDEVTQAGAAVADIIAAGIIPAGMEMMDKRAVEAAEQFAHAGYPLEAAAILIIELDGSDTEVAALTRQVSEILRSAGALAHRVR